MDVDMVEETGTSYDKWLASLDRLGAKDSEGQPNVHSLLKARVCSLSLVVALDVC